MGSQHVVLSPALPSELLAYVIARCAYPTTLVVCSSSEEFIRSCVSDAEEGDAEAGDRIFQTASLLQVAVARHIRVAFVPTVAHLRAFLAAFDPGASRVAPPPEVSSGGSGNSASSTPTTPSLLVYGFLQLHRDTSEWSAQGLGATAAVLAEAAWRHGWDAVVVDAKQPKGSESTGKTGANATDVLLDEKIPVLSTVPRRQLQRAGYPLRTERVRAVLGRWFEFRPGTWDESPPSKGGEPEACPAEEESQRDELEWELERELEPAPRPERELEPETRKTYVKDSEDEDELLSEDEEILYPIEDTATK